MWAVRKSGPNRSKDEYRDMSHILTPPLNHTVCVQYGHVLMSTNMTRTMMVKVFRAELILGTYRHRQRFHL